MPVSYGKHSNLTAFEIKTSVLQNAWPFYVYQSDQRAIEYISLMWTLLSDWHIRFAEGCLWYLKYSLFWCLVGGISITQCYFTQYLSITTLASTGLFMIVTFSYGLFSYFLSQKEQKSEYFMETLAEQHQKRIVIYLVKKFVKEYQ